MWFWLGDTFRNSKGLSYTRPGLWVHGDCIIASEPTVHPQLRVSLREVEVNLALVQFPACHPLTHAQFRTTLGPQKAVAFKCLLKASTCRSRIFLSASESATIRYHRVLLMVRSRTVVSVVHAGQQSLYIPRIHVGIPLS